MSVWPGPCPHSRMTDSAKTLSGMEHRTAPFGRRGGGPPPAAPARGARLVRALGTARARGTSSDLLLSRAVQRPAAQSALGRAG